MSDDRDPKLLERRTFLAWASAASLAPAWHVACRSHPPMPIKSRESTQPNAPDWSRVRLVHGDRASALERTSLADAAQLLSRALGFPEGQFVPVANERTIVAQGGYRSTDILLTCPQSSPGLTPDWTCQSSAYGSFRTRIVPREQPPSIGGPVRGPFYSIIGADPEGVRNGLYRFLNAQGFGFFRDGDTIPELSGKPMPRLSQDRESSPAFRYRGDMIWDFYAGPQRYCAATWSFAEWRRALLFLARRGCNFLEYYPPLQEIMRKAFSRAETLKNGLCWTARHKHELARRVVRFGRSLGIEFMYVLTYGQFPEPVQTLHADLQWRNGFLCAHQPELADFTRTVWSALIDEFGTDHWYAVRHRGEEGQSYSDPCRSVSKAQGMTQAFDILRGLDPQANVTVWTWAEKLPDLFAELPGDIRAAHIRHGMGGVFSDTPVGREQSDGAPALPRGRRWLAGQFTVFSGNETLLQNQWSDVRALASDARAAASDPQCDGFFQWPEWSGTSPWMAEAIAELAWNPESFRAEDHLNAYAQARHGTDSAAFLAGFRPLCLAGNARFVSTPRKRMLNPYTLSSAEMQLYERVRRGLAEMLKALSTGASEKPMFLRDLIDLACWLAVRQVQHLEVAAFRGFTTGKRDAVNDYIAAASAAWAALTTLLSAAPDTSIAGAARAMAIEAELSPAAEDWFFVQSSDFYGGYPLVLSPESIGLAYAPQTRRLGEVLIAALDGGETQPLAPAAWFWHDCPDPKWAKSVRLLPREDSALFERDMRQIIRDAFAEGAKQRAAVVASASRSEPPPWAVAALPQDVIANALPEAVATLLNAPRPAPLTEPPEW